MEDEEAEFKVYYERWLEKLESLMHELLVAPRDPDHVDEQKALIDWAFKHYEEHYAAKADFVRRDVGRALRPPWLSSLERGLLWMGGWKPTVAFRLAFTLKDSGVFGEIMAAEKVEELEKMREKTRAEEKAVEEEKEAAQAAAAAEVLGVERGSEAEERGMRRLVEAAEKAVLAADELRLDAMRRAVAVLTPLQAVDFLSSAAMLHVRVHEWGILRDRQGQCDQ